MSKERNAVIRGAIHQWIKDNGDCLNEQLVIEKFERIYKQGEIVDALNTLRSQAKIELTGEFYGNRDIKVVEGSAESAAKGY